MEQGLCGREDREGGQVAAHGVGLQKLTQHCKQLR